MIKMLMRARTSIFPLRMIPLGWCVILAHLRGAIDRSVRQCYHRRPRSAAGGGHGTLVGAGEAITAIVVGMNFFADGLQDAIDPRREASGKGP